MFIGELLGKIEYKDCNSDNISIKNLYTALEIEVISNKLITINSIEFSQIPGYDNYYISKNGTVFSKKRNILLIRNFNHAGYPTVALVDNSGYRSPKKVHRLVYLTYNGNLIDGMVIDHLDGNKQNPNYKNLEQISAHENVYRAIDMSLMNSRFSIDEIHQLCKLLEDNTPTIEIMNILDIPQNQENYRALIHLVHRIRSGKSYTNISKKYNISKKVSGLNKKDRIFDSKDIIDIRDLFDSKMLTIQELAIKYNCTTKTISDIVYYKKWKNLEYAI